MRRMSLASLRRRCSGVSGNVRPPIHEPLAEAASDDHRRTLHILDAETHARVVSELELGKVAVQMHLAAMLVNALHATLEDAEIAFDRVGMHGVVRKADILAAAVSDRAVAGVFGANVRVEAA